MQRSLHKPPLTPANPMGASLIKYIVTYCFTI